MANINGEEPAYPIDSDDLRQVKLGMSINDILEGNRLIAEFMGAVYKKDDYDDFGYFFPENSHSPTVLSALKYHSSWIWLMEVVEKIESIHHIFEGYCINVRISQGYVEIQGTRGVKIFRNTSIEGSKIKALWLAVVDFIKWYNTQTPNTNGDK